MGRTLLADAWVRDRTTSCRWSQDPYVPLATTLSTSTCVALAATISALHVPGEKPQDERSGRVMQLKQPSLGSGGTHLPMAAPQLGRGAEKALYSAEAPT